jgi:phage terminase large subunit-like protein
MSATTIAPGKPIPWNVEGIQRDFCASQARFRTLVAGRRFGKNHSAIISQAEFAFNPDAYDRGRDDPSHVVLWWVGPTYTQTRKYGFERAKDALPPEAIADTRNTQPFEIKLANGVRWEFYSYDRPKSLDGAGVDDLTIDERGYMPTSVWEDNLAAMLLDTDGRAAFIGKPWPNDHFRECFEKGQSEDYPSYDSWRATSYDSPAVEDDVIDELFGDLPEPIYQREILAQFDAGGKHLTRDMLSFVDIAELPDHELSWHVAADLGAEADPEAARQHDTDYWAAVIVGYDRYSSTAYLIDCIRERGMTKDQAAVWLDSIMDSVPTNQVRIESNQAQVFFVQEAKKQGLNAVGIDSTRPKEERLMYLSVPFSNDRVKLVNHNDPDDRPLGLEYDARWEPFVDEWVGFPGAAHDDVLDATEMCLRDLKVGGSIQAYGGTAYGGT